MICLCQQCQHKVKIFLECTRKLPPVHSISFWSALEKSLSNMVKNNEKANTFFFLNIWKFGSYFVSLCCRNDEGGALSDKFYREIR